MEVFEELRKAIEQKDFSGAKEIAEKIDEAYTSKADALALEPIEQHETYLGKRKHRGLYISSIGVAVN
ncbi:hypothetical protein, partial [Thermotoga sp.]|uniref:hypothetical protein n=1 Tax=Thermotoga sp. TaxID=28240 RepID=UPI0025FE3581